MPLHSLAPESELSDQIVPTDCSLCCLDCSVGLIWAYSFNWVKKRETRQLNFGFEFICQSERAPTVFSDILFDLKLRINLNISYFLQKDWEDNICLSFIICFFPYNNDFLSHCIHECILLGRQKKVFLTWYIIKWAFKKNIIIKGKLK